jgi:DMSO/TMAO reductase YedYZ molybdopterin-dependent catalytic subunit
MPGQQAWLDFWESLGYHNRGDPWREERYWGD